MELSPGQVEALDASVLEKPLDLSLPLDLRSRYRLTQEHQSDLFAPRAERSPSSGEFSLLLSDSERTKRALDRYDELARKEPFSAKSYNYSELADKTPNTAVQAEPRGTRIDLSAKKTDWSQSIYDYNPNSFDQKGQQAKLQIERTRQRSFDRVADMIHPGFGRMEFKVGENNVRFDYLNARRCKLKGAGLCVQIGFK